MILEIAQIEVKAGMEAAFEEGVTKAAPIFQRAKGCKGMELQRSLEQPARCRYRLFVRWQALENHTVDFPARPTSTNGASSSGIASSARPRSSTRRSPCTASGASAARSPDPAAAAGLQEGDQYVIDAALMMPPASDAAPRNSAAASSSDAMRCDRFGTTSRTSQ